MNNTFRKLCIKLLDDDHGISREAYEELLEMASIINGIRNLIGKDSNTQDIFNHVKATDDRFYLDKNWNNT